MSQGKDVSGQVFDRLTAVEAKTERWHTKILWKCRYECGNPEIVLVTLNSLTSVDIMPMMLIDKGARTESLTATQAARGGPILPEMKVVEDTASPRAVEPPCLARRRGHLSDPQ